MMEHNNITGKNVLQPRSIRPTIAFFVHEIRQGIGLNRWRGVADAAREADVNLLCFTGQYCRQPGHPGQANVVYALAESDQIDGIVFGGVARDTLLSQDEILEFYKRYPVPAVTIRESSGSLPYVFLDNYQGMYEAMRHLIETHGYTRIAFLRGPEEHPYAQERYRAYKDAVKAYQIPLEPQLISPPYGWNQADDAVPLLFDERRLRPQTDIEVIVAVNDTLAFGAIRALQARGIRVPDDVAVIGFNNGEECRSFNPPLTSVAMPFYDQGRQAVNILLKLIEGQSVPERMTMPAKLVIRQSCGCLDPGVLHAAAGPVSQAQDLLEVFSGPRRQHLIAEIINETHAPESAGTLIEKLLQDFVAELRGEPGVFLSSLNEGFCRIVSQEHDLVDCQDMLSTFRRMVLPYVRADKRNIAEDLWQQARLLIGQIMQRTLEHERLQISRKSQTLRDIGSRLISTFHVKELMEVLAEELPRLGIPICALALYEEPAPYEFPQSAPEWSRLMLAYTEQGRIDLGASGHRFPSQQILPLDIWPQERSFHMIVQPLYFQQEQIGFVVLEAASQDGSIYEALRGEMSSALQGALLVERVQEHAQELATAYEEIRILNDQLTEENVRMGTELDIARRLQLMLLPPREELGQIEGLEVVGYMQPADEVGGDYYDVLGGNGMLHISIGDVTGHGLESGVLMLMTQTAIRTLIEYGETDPAVFVKTLNRTIYKNVQRMGADKSLTFSLINYHQGQVKIVGQHESLLVIRQGGRIERVDTVNLGFPIGLVDEIQQWVHEATIFLEPGDGVVLYTDGVTEAENERGELYGLDRLCNILSSHWQEPAEHVKEAVVKDVIKYIGRQKIFDDLTLVVLKQQA